MSSFKAALLCLCLARGACGFQPRYAQTSGLQRDDIAIAIIPDRDGQELRNLLIDRLQARGVSSTPRYELRIAQLEKTVTGFGIRKDASATRTQMQIDSKMELVEKATGAVILKRDLRALGASDVLDSQFATVVSRQAMTRNMLQDMADEIVGELNLHFRRAAAP